MVAKNFFKSPDIKLKPIRSLSKRPDITESHRLNYSLITLVTRELSDSLSVWSERGLISKKDVSFFEKLANSDNDTLYELYQKYNVVDQASEDFTRVIGIFDTLSIKSLSDYQISSEPVLPSILSVIYQISYLKNVIPSICAAIGRVSDKNTLRILNEKHVELKKWFTSKYITVSNQKNFDFDKFNPLIYKMLKMTRAEYVEFSNKLNENN